MTERASPDSRIYLDHNAASPLRPGVRAAMLAAMDRCGNPSSIHAEGREARRLLEEARERVAAALGRRSRDVVFVSGGTEGVAFALGGAFGPAGVGPCDLLVASAGEHACVLQGHAFAPERTVLAPLDGQGRLDLGRLEEILRFRAPARPLLALQAANNETGVIQPVNEAARLIRAAGGLVACDAVQALGRIDCARQAFDGDVVIVSSHKLGGPKGVGALAFDADRLHVEGASVRGGGQERGWRAGTQNVAGAVGFGVACEEAVRSLPAEAARLEGLRERLEAAVKAVAPDVAVFGAGAPRLPNTSAFGLPGEKAETLVIALDLAGVAVSSGSACSSGKVEPSHVLSAMGIAPHLARGALRASLGWSTLESDVDVFCDRLQKTLISMRSRRVGRAA